MAVKTRPGASPALSHRLRTGPPCEVRPGSTLAYLSAGQGGDPRAGVRLEVAVKSSD